MSIQLDTLPQRIQSLRVEIESFTGTLTHDSHYRFAYIDGALDAISLSMPIRTDPYVRGALHPIFEMNLPEGYVRRYLSERLQRYTRISDMLFLAIQGNEGIGRLRYVSAIERSEVARESLDEILAWKGHESLFQTLLDKHLFNTTVSGMQPKVVVPSDKASMVQPDLIIKTGGEEYEQLPLNEFVCMSIASNIGLPTPDFWLSDNRDLFIMSRFDIKDNKHLGMEDFAVLMGRSGDQRYLGSYENAAKVVSLYTGDQEQISRFFEYVSLSCMLGNGDAHLKNFALLYESTDSIRQLSPIYDLVCTQVYPKEAKTLALKLNGSRAFANHQELLKFGANLGVKDAAARLERMADLMTDTLDQLNEAQQWPALHQQLKASLSNVMALKSTRIGYIAEHRGLKKRKTDAL